MGYLHELIAVEKDVRGTFDKLVTETKKTFTDRKDHFLELFKTYTPLDPNDPEKVEGEAKPMVTTAKEKLQWIEKIICRLADVIIQKELTNAIAKADIIIDENDVPVTIASDVPVTALVQYENVFERLRADIYGMVPTLDPAKAWTAVHDRPGVHTSPELQRSRTRKKKTVITLAVATDKHPPQAQIIDEDVIVGTTTQIERSGMMTVGKKAELLERIDILIEGIKKARARANSEKVINKKIGMSLINFINK